MEYRYKSGQKVRVKLNLIKFKKEYYMKSGPDTTISDLANSEMSEYCGKIIKIEDIGSNGKYRAVGWNWTDEMFVSSKPFVCESLL